MNLNEVKKLLSQYRICPSKRLGQNFLISDKILEKIIKTALLSKKDSILEIGAGIGNLTSKLAERAGRVIAIEKDQRMANILKKVLKKFKNVKIINKDVLKLDINNLKLKNYKVVANIPYYLTSRLIRNLLERENPPKQIILMVQKEVAQRICPKNKKMNLLALSVWFYTNPKIVSFVSKKSFWPRPNIDSAIIQLDIRKEKRKVNKKIFFKIIKAGFSQPRKKLVNSLSNGLKWNKDKTKIWLKENRINPETRAENLNIKDWFKLTRNFKNL